MLQRNLFGQRLVVDQRIIPAFIIFQNVPGVPGIDPQYAIALQGFCKSEH